MNINTINLVKIIEINSLVVSGGGMKGYIFLGCIKLLFELNIIKRIKYYYGTSIGGFINVFLILGWNMDEIYKFALNFSIGSIFDLDFDYFIKNYGLVPKINYETIIKKIISYKGYDPEITLSELYKVTSKEFNLMTFSLKINNPVVLNHINNPDLMLWESLYMSAALPILVPPYSYKNDLYIDGGIDDNFPIDRVKYENRSKIIGICGGPYQPIWSEIETYISNKDILYYLLEIFKISFSRPDKSNITNFIELTNSKEITYNFKLNRNDREQLIETGYKQSILHIDKLIKNMYLEQIILNKKLYNKYSIYNEI